MQTQKEMPQAQNQNVDILSSDTNTANSAISLQEGRRAIVQLDPDHPGFRDLAYRERRNQIAQIAIDYLPGTPVPDAPYTPEEHEAWREVWRNLSPAHQQFACREYHEAAAALALPTDRLPQLREVSERLQALSGFRLEPAGGLVDPKVFLSTLGDGIFLATQYIRHPSTPLYTPEPDVVHELCGHAITLASPKLAEINRWIGAAAKVTHTPEAIERLGRIYWFTVEFGVLREEGEIKAYGAGLLSSAGELQNIPNAEIRPFDIDAIMAQAYDVTKYQPILFCVEDFDAFRNTLQDTLSSWQG